MDCGISRECESESSDSSSTSVGGLSKWGSWRHAGYCLTQTLDPTTEVTVSTQSMNLTRDLSDILNRLLRIESGILNRILMVRQMDPNHIEADVVYANHRGQDSSEDSDSDPPPPPPLSP